MLPRSPSVVEIVDHSVGVAVSTHFRKHVEVLDDGFPEGPLTGCPHLVELSSRGKCEDMPQEFGGKHVDRGSGVDEGVYDG